jgi:hypothetical protein
MKSTTIFKKRATMVGSTLALALFASLSLTSTALAKPGGNGGDGDPDGDPIGDLPNISAIPIEYEVRFFEAADPADWADNTVPEGLEANPSVHFNDINRDGVAVGYISRDAGTNVAIMATTAGGLQVLGTVFAESLATPGLDGFRISSAYDINADGWTACLMIHSSSSEWWVGVGNVNAGGSLRLVSGPLNNLLSIILVSDMNEDGDLIVIESTRTGKRDPWVSHDQWLHPATKDPRGDLVYVDPPVHLTPILSEYDSIQPKLNTHGQIAYQSGEDTFRLDLINEENTILPHGPHSFIGMIADDGSVYTFKTHKSGTRKTESEGYASRWSPKTGLLHPLAAPLPGSSAMFAISVSAALSSEGETVEVLTSRGGQNSNTDDDLEIFRHDGPLGTRFPVSVSSGELGTWDDANWHELREISRPNGSGHGLICGQAVFGEVGSWEPKIGLILIPVTP